MIQFTKVLLMLMALMTFREIMAQWGPNGATPDPSMTKELIGYGFEPRGWYEHP